MLISSCSGPNKTRGIIEFTAKLTQESKSTVNLGHSISPETFGNQLDFVKRAASVKINPIKNFAAKSILSFSSPLAALPIANKDLLYFITKDGKLTCYDYTNQKQLWQSLITTQDTKLDSVTMSLNNGTIIVTADLYLYSFSAQDGKMLGKVLLDDMVKDYPSFSKESIFIKTAGNKLIAYNHNSLNQIWHVETWSDNVSSLTFNSPIIWNNQVINGYSSGQIIASNLVDGSQMWEINMLSDDDAPIGSQPIDLAYQSIETHGDMYVATSDGHLMNVSLQHHGIKWKRKVEDIISMSKSGDIFLTNNARQIAAISAQNGNVLWVNDLQNNSSTLYKIKTTNFTPPILTNIGLFVFAGDGGAFLVNPTTGDIEKYFTIAADIFGFVILKDNIVIFNRKNAYELH